MSIRFKREFGVDCLIASPVPPQYSDEMRGGKRCEVAIKYRLDFNIDNESKAIIVTTLLAVGRPRIRATSR